MTTATFPILESNNRPSDIPWSDEENQRYAANRAETVRLANERAARKRDGVWTLVGGIWSAKFDVRGDIVVVTHTRGRGAWGRSEEPVEMTRVDARKLWAELVENGYQSF